MLARQTLGACLTRRFTAPWLSSQTGAGGGFKRSAHSAGPARYTRLFGWIGLFANLLLGAEGFSIFGEDLAL